MAFYLSSKNIPELANYSIKEKHEILAIAANKLITPEKLFLNIIKLLILIPAFIMMAKLDGWFFAAPLAFVLVSFFIIMRPISLNILRKHLPKSIKQFEHNRQH
jgi:hypothetical protein